ncbi:cytosol aminopeptidase, partial [Dunaliella salina]
MKHMERARWSANPTLTGAARSALGANLPAVFSSCDETWSALEAAGIEEDDPIWRLPLHKPYRKMIESKVADISSTAGEGAQGGAIIAALFLREFCADVPRWLHIDTSAWTNSTFSGPGKPEGGEALGLRALWRFVSARYGTNRG